MREVYSKNGSRNFRVVSLGERHSAGSFLFTLDFHCNCRPEAYAGRMSSVKQIIAVVSLALLFVMPVARAGVATLEGIVNDASGRALQGAEIRIQGSGSKIGIVHTDARGHYAYPALETGAYEVSLVVNGVVKASIKNVKTQVGQTQTLNFDIHRGAEKPFARGKHYVWVPASELTGTHIGAWIEVDDSFKPSTGAQERMRNEGNSFIREFQNQHPAMGSRM